MLEINNIDQIDQEREEHYQERERVASEELRPLINSFLQGEISLSKFRSSVDGINKSNDYWGFNGFAGMMHFNKLVKCEGAEEIIRETLSLPEDMEEAENKIQKLDRYTKNVREQAETNPAPKSNIFFLSYFWNIQDPGKFPIFQKSSRDLLEDKTDYSDDNKDYAELYRDFVNRLDQLVDQYDIKEDRKYDRINRILYRIGSEEQEQEEQEAEEIVEETSEGYTEYIPPKVADLSEIAEGSNKVQQEYDIDLAVLMEKKTDKVFEMMGFKTKQLGQGSGREPDGIAYSLKGGFAVVWDTKKRENGGYKIGTSDERKIKEYVNRYSRIFDQLDIQRVYFLTISSDFSDTTYKASLDQLPKIRNINFMQANDLTQLLGLTIKHPNVRTEDLEALFRESSLVEKEQLPQIIPDASIDEIL